MQTLVLSWSDLHQDARNLAEQLKKLEIRWDSLVAVTRGGLVPAAILAHELDIRHIETVCVASYEDVTQAQNDLQLIKEPTCIQGRVLVIDDLVDTGDTLSVIEKILPQAHCAALYAKPKGRGMVQTYIREVSQDTWIVFPWEESSVISEVVA